MSTGTDKMSWSQNLKTHGGLRPKFSVLKMRKQGPHQEAGDLGSDPKSSDPNTGASNPCDHSHSQ